MTSEAMSISLDVEGANRVSDLVAALDGNLNDSSSTMNQDIKVRLTFAAVGGDIEGLYKLIAEDPNILGHYDQIPFCETPLHIAARNGRTHFAMELMTLKPSLALKLNTSGSSPMHLALQNTHIQMVRGFIAIDNSLVSIKGRGRITPLHQVAQRGDAELLSEFLFACPSSVEDLTIECETAMHVALKNHQTEAFKVLLGWVKRVNREEILNWKDEDGNTVLHIAASNNQTEVMKLLRGTVKLRAKNLAGETAKDILSRLFPEASSLYFRADVRLFFQLFGSTTTLAGYLHKKPSYIEKWNNLFGLTNLMSKTRHRSLNSNDTRTVILVVAILIVTTTYQANLNPPGGFWQEDSSNPKDDDGHYAGQIILPSRNALYFLVLNGLAFFLSLFVIMILTVGLPMWMILHVSTAFLGFAISASFSVTLPNTPSSFQNIVRFFFVVGYPVITAVVCAPFTVFLRNTLSRAQVDFPARYFTSPHELS